MRESVETYPSISWWSVGDLRRGYVSNHTVLPE